MTKTKWSSAAASTPSGRGGYDHIVSRIAILVDELKEATGLTPERIGIGTPGTIDPPTGLMKNSNTVVLNGQPLGKDLEAAIGVPLTPG